METNQTSEFSIGAIHGAAPHPGAILTVKALTKNFKGLVAVDNFSMDLYHGEIVGLIGPNGAGKTTVFNLLTGVLSPTGGSIMLKDKELTRLSPDRITRLGIARTFQNIRLFPNLTVLQNLLVAVQIHKNCGFLSTIFSTPRFVREEEELVTRAWKYLEALGIAHYHKQEARNLPYGAQRKLEVARALAAGPAVLLLDEPAAGMNPQETLELMQTIRRIKDEFSVAVILIEHDMNVVMNLCHRLLVLSYGKTIAEGTPAEIKNNPTVINAYLGRSAVNA
ncbi:MAG: Lipopolysaccharide export system ATP-binding protein LptB [Firmicutes bacterium ADurb.Bin456]|nr:MAG: Lipopolysaccharide export system ATP-binding protein LptB [Firmicutes bacterium ADurb.Bin456]